MSEMMWLNVGIAVVNVVLAGVIGTVYVRNHREIRSPLTLGLALFALFFVLHNVVLVVHYVTMMPSFGTLAESYLLGEGVLQTAAMGAIAWVTLR